MNFSHPEVGGEGGFRTQTKEPTGVGPSKLGYVVFMCSAAKSTVRV